MRITGLVAATHTPFHQDGSLNLDRVETQVEHLLRNRISYAFIGGTTGESASLTLEERKALAARWMEVAKSTDLQIIVHVGANCLHDACDLAQQAQLLGAVAISAHAPSYFKPASASSLARCMAEIAQSAPELPFYYYEIPSMTGITLTPSAFLAEAYDIMPNLAGLKFTSNNFMEYQLCQQFRGASLDVSFGFDEMLLAALALGAKGAVGSSFNFAAPIYHRLIHAFHESDMQTAREYQYRSVQLIQLLASHGYMAAAKATMKMLGVDVGPPRLPTDSLSSEKIDGLQNQLEKLGFFEWLKPPF